MFVSVGRESAGDRWSPETFLEDRREHGSRTTSYATGASDVTQKCDNGPVQVRVGAEAIVVCAGCFLRWPTGANALQNAKRAVNGRTRFIHAPQNGKRARPSRAEPSRAEDADLPGQTKVCARRTKKVRLPFMSASLGLRATD